MKRLTEKEKKDAIGAITLGIAGAVMLAKQARMPRSWLLRVVVVAWRTISAGKAVSP